MRSSVTFAVACGAIALTAFAADSAKAANAWGGSYCMSDREGRSDCSFTTLAQCQASASGTDAGCYARPRGWCSKAHRRQHRAGAPRADLDERGFRSIPVIASAAKQPSFTATRKAVTAKSRGASACRSPE